MKRTKEMYYQFIEENEAYIAELKEELVKFNEIYKRRVYDKEWSPFIHKVIDQIKLQITRQFEEIDRYIKRLGEVRREHDQAYHAQLGQNKESFVGEEESARNSIENAPGIEQKDMGIAQEKADSPWSED